MEYSFNKIEPKWQDYWRNHNTYKVEVDKSKPKFYVLDMFPYPSGAGLHVGHPLGYIASDIYARFKRQKGFNVLHPMGYDAYGLPAEQYAIQTGQHPAITTENNIKRYREQLDKIGFSFDWNREVRTCDPDYYKWTQWAFIQMFQHWFNEQTQKAEPIDTLIAEFNESGNHKVKASASPVDSFTAEKWKTMTEKEQQEILLSYRIAYLADTVVNWCPELGTVLANDEVKDGVSVRGGHPVVQKTMRQWSLRVSAYAERLLQGLEKVDWSDSLKEIQRNWIGKSTGAAVDFKIDGHDHSLEIFTTRPDTLYGATFMVLAPEHDLVREIAASDKKQEVEDYIKWALNRNERERIADAKSITGVFTGAYGINPITNEKIPIWIADYVLMGYGTGAIMAVPAHDSRDFAFAKHFGLSIKQVVVGHNDSESDPANWDDSYDAKEGKLINSDIINGLDVPEAITKITDHIQRSGIGKKQTNYKLRDAIFSRQRYWGEPFPVYYKNDMPYVLEEDKLPLELPEVDKYLPTEDGQPPLGRAQNWTTEEGYPLELNTMPGFAGSSAYYIRYMDPHNNEALVSKEANSYWQDVDLYIGGTEHATGHLIYSRFWNKFLFDIGIVEKEEPYKKLINQGMIQGRSNFVYRIKGENKFVSYSLRKQYDVTPIHVDVNIVDNDVLDVDAFRKWRPEFKDAEFILEDGKYVCGYAVEKMSKSMFNVVNPDDIIAHYGADTLRLYEMFLGPVEQSKPWDTKGIDGVHRFLKKFWRLYFEGDKLLLNDEAPNEKELKILHKTIHKIEHDIERFSYNTAISAFMICVNDLADLKCHKRAILKPLTVMLSPFAPHIAEELWQISGHESTIVDAEFPAYDEQYLKEDEIEYPVSFNGKTRFKLSLPADASKDEIEKTVLDHEKSQKYLDGKTPRKVIIVPKRIINIVV
ncbi:Leucine--tRNA ligase [Salinivirga cyanobacteriivorans]|uniref:Leucine--tRNA ligase n=1 Tax=Salinivirga cyanobacteriivorans TaxID=1307839 RepID=A0A0S2HY44_9BACT|nr:leucine--tRNA ligase [Salinivirga cyanobacteriivorans]ALO15033.1 Leucine--tRNA ligase [Salinivirga cyanobacteriivorans]